MARRRTTPNRPRARTLGELRPSQIVGTFGPGAVVDLPTASLIVAGTDYWAPDVSRMIDEPRLRSMLRVSAFYRPAVKSDSGSVGVPAFLFPRYLVCPRCDRLAPYQQFAFDGRGFRCGRAHKGSTPRSGPLAFPARFVVACSAGHLDDFPWFDYLHQGERCKGDLEFWGSGSSGSVGDLHVRCRACGRDRSMAQAFGPSASKVLGQCRGHRPWLSEDNEEPCTTRLRTLLRGASNLYFPVVQSALSIPEWDDPIQLAIAHHEEALAQVGSPADIAVGIKMGFLPGLAGYEPETIWEALQARRAQAENPPSPIDLRHEEYLALRSEPNLAEAHRREFEIEPVTVPKQFNEKLARLVVVRRLKEVRALDGFSRIDSAFDVALDDDQPETFMKQALSANELHWRPAVELRGEGIFVELDEAEVQKWEARLAVVELAERLETAHMTWRRERDLPPTVRSSLIPVYELPRVEPRLLPGEGLEMGVLADCATGERLRELLAPLLVGYEEWIELKTTEVSELPSDLQKTAGDHLADCRDALRRMTEALDALAQNEDALRAFRFANHAMLLQRSHSVWAAARRKQRETAPTSPTIEGRWRPFQLAFILVNLPGLIDPRHADRRVGDLLWFPTGGGKTEAYLGLTAFVLGYRRLRSIAGYRTDAGVAVLMRYTLRLLTIQQFQRAVALMCACETIRVQDIKSWGSRRFSIGLWVGASATPTSHAESRTALARLKAGERQTDRNPCQLENCPWCGEKLQPKNYVDDADALRTFVFCPRGECEFSTKSPLGLPVVLVDEEIYRECPSMLIATVDKFAQMPWNGQIQALFGRVEEECERCGFLTPGSDHSSAHAPELIHPTEKLAPLDLIIQDELHLISGPLGTLVGLYETAVNALSSRFDGDTVVAPKVIASTATVRRAFEQVHALFDRPLKVFPPPGLDPADSYFAVEAPVTPESPGRIYVGVMGPGKSMKTAVVRLAAILMATAQGLANRDAKLSDPYRTLVMYFNSLRELGGAVRLMDDDVVSRLDQLRLRGLPRTFPPDYAELTSRISSEQIPALLRQLEQPHDAPRDDESPYPLDAVLASNMISVGVDVDRLALMSVMGQPKTTAEYIQATGRVGRQTWAPGLVVTLYNWVRPRDLSHYERFLQYHATFYRSIEAVSATPFSSRARDRGLPGALVSMARLGDFVLAGENAAEDFDMSEPTVVFAIEQLRRRAESVADPSTAADVEHQVEALLSRWEELAADPLRYGWRAPDQSRVPPSAVLLRRAEGGLWGEWETPGSLREVEETSRVYLLGLDGS